MSTNLDTAGLDPLIASAGAIFRRVLVPVDYTMDSHRAVGVALDLQRAYGSAVCLFHAAESTGSDEWLGGIGSPSVGGDWIAESEARLRRFIHNVAPWASTTVEVLAEVGEPLRAIRHAARAWGATLVVAAAPVLPTALRSPAERLVHAFEIPTLIIPAG